jgi:hypothetical protein
MILRYSGAALLALLLAAVMASCYPAPAYAEPTPTREHECIAAMYPEAAYVYLLHHQGTGLPLPVVRYLVLTNPELGGAGRWVLVSLLDMMALADALGRPLDSDATFTYLRFLCRQPLQTVERLEVGPWPLHDEHKGI